MTKLDFLKEHFKHCTVIVTEPENDSPYAKIYTDADAEPVTVYYESDDYQPYMVRFSFQHVHCFSEEDALEWAEAYLSGEKSAIEFFISGRPCFGGDIDSVLPADFTAEALQSSPFGKILFSRPIPENLTFQVRSLKQEFCFDGRVDPDGTVAVMP